MNRFATLAALSLVLASASTAHANDGDEGSLATDRFVFNLRADFSQVSSGDRDFLGVGASLGAHVPLGDLPLGVSLSTSLITGEGHLLSTTDLGFRYYLPTSGRDPGRSLQPYTRFGAALSVLSWDVQDTTTTIGGVLGIGLQAFFTEHVALDFEISYRVMGGAELRQTLIGSVGLAFGT